MLQEMYARYRAGDLTPTRYHEDKGDGLGRSILFLPLVIDDEFRGVTELIWHERADLILDM
jgi:hypothetical protein